MNPAPSFFADYKRITTRPRSFVGIALGFTGVGLLIVIVLSSFFGDAAISDACTAFAVMLVGIGVGLRRANKARA